MRGTNRWPEFDDYTDNQLLQEMKTNDNAHSYIYLKHKTYCINFLFNKGSLENDAQDIYQDATIILYEKVQNPEFRLTCSIQTYLNSVCYYQLLSKAKSNYAKKIVHAEDIDENVKDWFEEETELTNEKIEKLLKEYENWKVIGHKCYERLRLFYYEKLSMKEIASRLGFSDAVSAKSQIDKCRSRLKIILGV